MPRKPKKDDDAAEGSPSVIQGTLYVQYLSANAKQRSKILLDWFNVYEQDQQKGAVAIVNFFIESCGCPGTVQEEGFESVEIESVLKSFAEKYNKELITYPIVQPKSKGDTNAKAILSFWANLIRSTPLEYLLDGYLMDTIIAWLTPFSEDSARAFRHTATLVATSLMTYLAELRTTLRSNKTQDKQVVSFIDTIFDNIFTKRYRDVDPKIRKLCVMWLGSVMDAHSDLFLSDDRVKYLGWLLSDKDPGVRVEVIEALSKLYEDDNKTARLASFTDKFQGRITDMTYDKNDTVSERAISLVNTCFKPSDEQVSYVVSLVADASPVVREAAIKFVSKQIAGDDDLVNIVKMIHKIHINSNEAGDLSFGFSDTLLSMLDDPSDPSNICERSRMFHGPRDGEISEFSYTAFFVDAAFNSISCIRSFKDMCELLLSEDSSLNHEEELTLFAIMTLAATKVSRENHKLLPSDAYDKKVIDGNWTAWNSSMNECVPLYLMRLLERFRTSGGALSNICHIITCLNPTSFAGTGMASALSDAADLLYSAFFSTSDITCCRFIVRALLYIKSVDKRKKKKPVIEKLADKCLNEATRNEITSLEQLDALLSEALLSEAESDDKVLVDGQLLAGVRDSIINVLERSITARHESIDDHETSMRSALAASVGTRLVLNDVATLFSILDQKEPLTREHTDKINYRILDLLISLLDTVKKNDIYASYSSFGSRDITDEVMKYINEGALALVIIDCIYTVCMMLTPRLEFLYSEEPRIKEMILKLSKDQQDLVVHTCEAILVSACDLCKKTGTPQYNRGLRFIHHTLLRLSQMSSFDIIGVEYIPRVLAHYLQYEKTSELIIKTLVLNLRDSMRNQEWPMILESLQLLYQAVKKDSGLMSLAFESSNKFAQLYGVGDKYSTAVSGLIMSGLNYVLDDNFDFIECLLPFTSRVGGAHARDVLRLVDTVKTKYNADEKNDKFNTLFEIERRLRAKKSDAPANAAPVQVGSPRPRRKRVTSPTKEASPRRQRKNNKEEDGEDSDEVSEVPEEKTPTPSRKRNLERSAKKNSPRILFDDDE